LVPDGLLSDEFFTLSQVDISVGQKADDKRVLVIEMKKSINNLFISSNSKR